MGKTQEPHVPDWVRTAILEYVKIAKPNYPACIWGDVAHPLLILGGDATAAAWRTLNKRLAAQSDAGRANFVIQVCAIVAGALALPSMPPKRAKQVADKTRKAISNIAEALPGMLPFANQLHNAASLRLASAGAAEAAKDFNFSRELFAAMLTAFLTDVGQWERWNSRLPKPESAHASRLIFVRDVTQLFRDYFETPLRETVATLANAMFPDAPALDASTVAKLAPLNKSGAHVTSLHVLK